MSFKTLHHGTNRMEVEKGVREENWAVGKYMAGRWSLLWPSEVEARTENEVGGGKVGWD